MLLEITKYPYMINTKPGYKFFFKKKKQNSVLLLNNSKKTNPLDPGVRWGTSPNGLGRPLRGFTGNPGVDFTFLFLPHTLSCMKIGAKSWL